MKVRTSELTGAALDWAVAKADKRLGRGEVEGAVDRENSWLYVLEDSNEEMHSRLVQCYYSPSTNWAQGGPIIERERLGVCYYHEADGWEVPNWAAWRTDIDDRVQIMGETALIAAMRCFVAVQLGDEVDVPKELLK